MQDEFSQTQSDTTGVGIYVVRDGEGESARYAICSCFDVQAGDYILPGTSETLASLVNRQKLSAAHVPAPEGLTTLGWDEIEFDPQSGSTARLIYKK